MYIQMSAIVIVELPVVQVSSLACVERCSFADEQLTTHKI
jgi:hypothetical protein